MASKSNGNYNSNYDEESIDSNFVEPSYVSAPPSSNAKEDTPLMLSSPDVDSPTRPKSPLQHASAWKFWMTTSVSHRFYLLVLMSIIPFGGHFVKNGMSSIEQLMLDDPDFPITNTMYGALISVVSVPNMLIPLFGGRILDKRGHDSIVFFLAWICVGQAIFAIGMQLELFWLALFGRLFFGAGEGSVVVGSRVFVAFWFRNRELTFAMGVMVAVTNISKMLAKSTTAPIALFFGGYEYALWYGAIICVICVFVGILVVNYTTQLKNIVRNRVANNELLDPQLHWLQGYADKKRRQHQLKLSSSRGAKQVSCKTLKEFPRMFWVVNILHVTFINVFHLFQNVASSYLYQNYGYSLVKAGYISSLSHTFVIFAPAIGFAIDHFGGRLYMIILSSIMAVVAYAMMIFTSIDPMVSMVLISICLSFTPTILMAAIPGTVDKKSLGGAFGIVEVTDAIGATFGNILIGYLRDETGSFDADMYLLLSMAVLALVLSVWLLVEDRSSGSTVSAPISRSRAYSVDDEYPVAQPVVAGGGSSDSTGSNGSG